MDSSIVVEGNTSPPVPQNRRSLNKTLKKDNQPEPEQPSTSITKSLIDPDQSLSPLKKDERSIFSKGNSKIGAKSNSIIKFLY